MDEIKNIPRIGHARKIARTILNDIGVIKTPILIKDVVNHIKKSFDLSVYPWSFGDNTDGIQVTRDNIVAIGYNQSHHRHRQRFTVAHEIGHFLMGHTTGKLIFDLNSKKPEEIEANQFAAELLIPLSFLKNEIKNGNKNTQNLSKLFDVSEESIWWRLRECNLIGKI